jgi:hypothetical protein
MLNSLTKEFRIVDLKQIVSTIQQQQQQQQETTTKDDKYKLMKTDQQFMFVLKTIVCSSFVYEEEDDVDTYCGNTKLSQEESISWGEFLQFYRMCVVGMQTLEELPTGSSIRNRAKARTLRMLSLFGTPSMKQSNDCNNKKREEFKDATTNAKVVRKVVTLTKDACCDVLPHQAEWRPSWVYKYGILFLLGAVMIATVIGLISLTDRESTARSTNLPVQDPHFRKQTVFYDISTFQSYPDELTDAPITQIYATGNIKMALHPSTKTTALSSLVPLSRINLQTTKALIDNETKTNLLDTKVVSLKPTLDRKQEQSSHHDIDAVEILGGSTALLYLLLPLMKGAIAVTGPIVTGWIPTVMTVFIVSLIGQDIRKWFVGLWKKVFKPSSQFN